MSSEVRVNVLAFRRHALAGPRRAPATPARHSHYTYYTELSKKEILRHARALQSRLESGMESVDVLGSVDLLLLPGHHGDGDIQQ